ncbi:MAG TPA: YpdA family putative bacillithiol disulfide reductase [Sphingobacteriaceae bacterium]|nr:YpdA family putative bacillithiol disulfide reductase [Sphingobacteriaceae bacterium]
MAENIYDILIIGSGPIGLACGLEAKKAGLSYIIIEKGCLVNSLYNYPMNMTFFSTSERLEIGGVPFVSNNPKPTRPEALEYYRRVALSNELNINLFEEVQSLTKADNFILRTSKGEYNAKNVILATGFYDIPNKLNIPGESLAKVRHYYQDPHYYAAKKVIVVGANNSAVDAALETYHKGADVTMVIREAQIGERVKYWVRPDIVNRIKEGTIKAYFQSHLTVVKEYEAQIQTPEGLITIPNDFVLAMTGYMPNLDFLTKLGIHLSADATKQPEHDAETMETNIKGLYLAGVVCGGMNTHVWFIENSRVHAEKIIDHILSKNK